MAFAADVEIINLPFLEAIEFFKNKLNLLTGTWDEIWGAAHAKSFTVAGVAKEDLLTDLRGLIDQALNDGTTLDTFRKGFDEDWSPNRAGAIRGPGPGERR